MPARTAARPRSRATASARSAWRSSCARRSRRCRCSGWMPTRAAARAASRPSWTASPPRLPASSWAPRWSLRAMTSPTWSWPSSRTPTPTCGSPTSGPRSAPSRSSRSWPAAAVAGRGAAACWSRRCARDTRSLRHAASPRCAGFLAEEVERRRALRYPPFSTLIRVSRPPRPGLCRRAPTARSALAGLLGGLDVLGPAPLFRVKDLCRTAW